MVIIQTIKVQRMLILLAKILFTFSYRKTLWIQARDKNNQVLTTRPKLFSENTGAAELPF